ncbi:MAG: porin [Paraglaciecola sp.]|uniref:OprO/OprP family phosphate-selective porin n=1 Tax=Paraglaciecola sp. TaxID=1920173 RepID=UPI00329A0094
MLIRPTLLLFVLSIIPSCVLAESVSTEPSGLKLTLNGPIELITSDLKYSVKLGGRLQWDYNYAELNGEADEDDFSIRRARLYFSGEVNDWSYKLQFNVGDSNGGTPEDVFIRYNGWGKKAVLTVGNQKEPFGFESLTSSKDITFLERSAITEAYAAGRNEGIQFSGTQGKFTYAIGVFEDDTVGDGSAITGRVTYSPIHSKEQVLHVGLAHSNRAADVDMTGVELAYSHGPIHLQSEFVSSENGMISRDGLYLQAGWIITGESRPYKNGVFKRVKPGSSSGAWEVVLRFEDGDGAYSDEELGNTDATSYGMGVNYYLSKFIRVGVSYTEAQDNVSEDDGSEFRARLQIAL